MLDIPDAVEPLVDYFRSISGEHPDWAEYRQAMIDQGKSLLRITPAQLGPDRDRRLPRPPGVSGIKAGNSKSLCRTDRCSALHPPADWRRWVVYQVYPRSFADSDADGVGDLRGVLGRLDYLERLGVDVVWLSPVYRSPMDDNGYDISDYTDIDPLFGTLADLDELIAELHARGMRLMMDLVVNHTSDEHPWFVESRSSRDNPKRDWYWWRDPRPGATPGTPGAEPTNWESHFSGPTWTWDERTGQYYLHIFSAKQPDLNWENPEVRQAVYAMMRWWLDRGVDGFRMDVINMISKDTSLPDTAPRPGSLVRAGRSALHLSAPATTSTCRRCTARSSPAARVTCSPCGEMPEVTIAQAALFTAPDRHELDMVFQFEHVRLDQGAHKYDLLPLTLPDLKTIDGRLAGGPGRAGLELALLRQPRPAALAVAVRRRRQVPGGLGQDPGHRPAPAPGHPLRVPGRRARDGQRALRRHHRFPRHPGAPVLRRGGRARRHRRRAGGAAAGHEPDEPGPGPHPGAVGRLARSRVHHRYPVDRGQPRLRRRQRGRPGRPPDSVFEHYRQLIALRHADPVVTDGEFELLLPEHPAIWAFVRRGRDAELLVAANFSAEPVSAVLPLDTPAGRTPRSCWPAIPTGHRGSCRSWRWRRGSRRSGAALSGLIGRENAKHATVRDNRL